MLHRQKSVGPLSETVGYQVVGPRSTLHGDLRSPSRSMLNLVHKVNDHILGSSSTICFPKDCKA